MPRIVKQPDIVQEILALKKRLAVLENAPRLTASTIQTNGNSRLAVQNSAAQPVFHAGDVSTSTPGVNVSGIAAYRTNGTNAFAAVSGSAGTQYGFIDQAGHAILQTNETGGYGLEDPSIPVALYSAANIPSTTSGSATILWLGYFNCTHIYLDISVQAAVSGGATGTIGIVINGTTVTSTTTTSSTFAVVPTFANLSASGTNQKTISSINVVGSITSGAGTLQVLVNYARLHGSLG